MCAGVSYFFYFSPKKKAYLHGEQCSAQRLVAMTVASSACYVSVNFSLRLFQLVLVRKGKDGKAEIVIIDHGLYETLQHRWVC